MTADASPAGIGSAASGAPSAGPAPSRQRCSAPCCFAAGLSCVAAPLVSPPLPLPLPPPRLRAPLSGSVAASAAVPGSSPPELLALVRSCLVLLLLLCIIALLLLPLFLVVEVDASCRAKTEACS
ncbi:unnamed protein product [Ectocarpus sp. 13 AM-2016]